MSGTVPRAAAINKTVKNASFVELAFLWETDEETSFPES